jgi:hypothetical protein
MGMFNLPRVREWWNRLAGSKGALSLSAPLIPIRSEPSQQDLLLSDFRLNQDKLWWCSFRTPGDEFVGVVICRGKSPGSAANSAINRGIVNSERASIVMIPLEKEAGFEEYQDRLLDADQAGVVLEKLQIRGIST